jgi:hypothetical protein
MSTKDWTDVLLEALNAPLEQKPRTLAERVQLEDFADRFAAAIEENVAKGNRDIATIASYLSQQDGEVDFAALEAVLKASPSSQIH